jgi:hypothetical protein
MAVMDARRTHDSGIVNKTDLAEWCRTHGSRIIKMDLTEWELRSMRSMFSDQSLTDVYIRTEEYDGVPVALVDTVDRGGCARRLDAALDFIGHRSSPIFRRRLADAYDRAAVAEPTTISERVA